LLKVVSIKDDGQDNVVGIDDVKAIVSRPFDAPGRGKAAFRVA